MDKCHVDSCTQNLLKPGDKRCCKHWRDGIITKRLYITMTFGILFLLTSCGGGNGVTAPSDFILPPQDRDLSGLEGRWTLTINFAGSIIPPDPQQKFDESGTWNETWEITTNGIKGSGWSYGNYGWSYDGSTLYAQWKGDDSNASQTCGPGRVYYNRVYEIKINPLDTHVDVNGTELYEFESAYCGQSEGTYVLTGNLSRL